MALTLKDVRDRRPTPIKVPHRDGAAPAVALRPWENFDDVKRDHGRDQSGSVDPESDASNGITGGINRDQEGDQSGSNGINKRDQSHLKRDQEGDQSGSNRQKWTETVPRPPDLTTAGGDLGRQEPICEPVIPFAGSCDDPDHGVDPVWEASRSHLEARLIPFKSAESSALIPFDPVKQQSRSHLQMGSQNGSKRDHAPLLPTAVQQLQVLRCLVQQQAGTGLRSTPLLKRREIAQLAGISEHMVKIQLRRLLQAGLVVRRGWRRGRGPAGAVYQVPEPVVVAVKRDQETGSNGIKRGIQTGSRPPVSSSSDLTTTTTGAGDNHEVSQTQNLLRRPEQDDAHLAEQLRLIAERAELTRHGIGANDLLPLWRRGVFTNWESLVASLEHIGFYLTLPDASGLRHPKAWALQTLRKGYYAAPVGFTSWEERLEATRLQDALRRQERLVALRRQRFQIEFDLWLAELPSRERDQYLHGLEPNSEPARAVLKGVFAKQSGWKESP